MEEDTAVLRESTTSGVQSESIDPICNINSETETKDVKDEENNKAVAVLKCIQKDLLAADLKWSLFFAASKSYKYDSCLRPFPPMFLQNDEKDISALAEMLSHIPAFTLLERFLQHPDKYQMNSSVINILHWVLVQLKGPKLESVPNSEIESVLNLVPSELFAQRPNYVFKVEYSHTSAQYKWRVAKEGYDSLFAYHGSRLENFHSILYYGLQQHLNKNSLFGQGIYLSSELLVSLPYSQNGYGWGKSVLGPELSIVTLCEMVDHPTINCQSKEGSGDKSRAIAKDSCAGEVPHKFYLVPNSDLVCVRFLLVYSRAPPFPYNEMQPKTVIGWVKEHKVTIVILGYMVLLASVGLSNNQYVQRCYKMLCQKIGLYF